MGRLLMVLDGGDMIALVGVDEPEYRRIWESYFDLDRDYGEINAALSRDAVVRNALNSAKGIRILRQDRWETLCSFIISQNNNIPRIKGIIGRLCADTLGIPRPLYSRCRTPCDGRQNRP